MNTTEPEASACVMKGIFCLYSSCRSDIGCRNQSECLCVERKFCLEPGAKMLTVGIDTPRNQRACCRIGCGCLEYSCIEPRILCGGADHVLCLQTVGSIPFHRDYLQEPVCALHFLQCFPKVDCCAPPPACPSLMKMKTDYVHHEIMDRGEGFDLAPTAEAEVVPYSDHPMTPVEAKDVRMV